MRLTWLADVLRSAGCKVDELPGWRTSGGPLERIEGVVWHHTASGRSTSDTAMASILRNGRPDLPGPLSQLGLTRDGTFVVIASGRCNHNIGTWGNQSIGIEAYNNGIGEPWPRAQLDAWDRGTAAILRHLGLTTAHVKGHRETDPGRKIDPAGVSMAQARQRIAHLLTYRPPPGDLDMDEKTLRRIVGEEIDKRINPDRKGNLLVRIRNGVATENTRSEEIVKGIRDLLKRA